MKLKANDNSVVEDQEECAEILNKIFISQFCKQYQLNSKNNYDCKSSSINISDEGVTKLILSLKNGKAAGPDDLVIDPIMTGKCLTAIFNASISNSMLLSEWKIAYMSPLHKQGPTDQPSNYRPISLTSISCKIIEHIVLHHLNLVLDKVLFNRQHGFRKGLSCETQLCSTYHQISKLVDNCNTVHAVVLDFTKAFDKVPHELLMRKLSKISKL